MKHLQERLLSTIIKKVANPLVYSSGKTTIRVRRPFYGGPLGRMGASWGFKPEILCLVVQSLDYLNILKYIAKAYLI